jgi:4-oxalocrotonate tautomerase
VKTDDHATARILTTAPESRGQPFKEKNMPYVHIRVTREGVTAEQKAQLIHQSTQMLVEVLNKDPATTFVVIDEVDTDNWGVAGEPVTVLRQRARREQL